jgi:opacity protein-like surface antigen
VFQGALSGFFTEAHAIDFYLGTRTNTVQYGSTINMKYPIFSRLFTQGYAGWNFSDSHMLLTVPYDAYSAGLDLGYAVDQHLNYFGGVGYVYTPKFDAYDKSLSAGIYGVYSSKTSGSIRVGVQDHEQTGQPKQDMLYVAGDLNWNPSRRWNLSADMNKQYAFTSTGVNTDELKFSLNGRYLVQTKLTWKNSLSYMDDKYDDISKRHDERYAFMTGLDYELGRRLTLGLAYTFLRSDSNKAQFKYDQNTVTISAYTRF